MNLPHLIEEKKKAFDEKFLADYGEYGKTIAASKIPILESFLEESIRAAHELGRKNVLDSLTVIKDNKNEK